MGYYLAPKAHLRPKQKTALSQKLLVFFAFSFAGVAAILIYGSLQFGNTQTAKASIKSQEESNVYGDPEDVDDMSNIPLIENSGHVNFPVQLSFFLANQKGNTVELKWASTAENKNECYVLEKSENGCGFNEIFCTDGAGTTRLSSDYSFTDYSPGDGVIFYRLRQTSTDGSSSYVSLEKVDMNTNKNDQSLYIKQVGPEPFDKAFNIDYYSEKEGSVSIQLIDKDGKMVYKSYTNAISGYNTCRFIDGGNLTDKEYTLKISNSNAVFLKKITRKV